MKNKLLCHPLTPDRWGDLETLFGPRGACGGCWCMVWRLPRKDFVNGKGAGNRAAFRNIVRHADTPPGILGYLDGEPVGWCAVAPREQFPFLERSRVLKRVDERPVWSVSCLLVHKKHRRKAITVELLRSAVDFVRRRGGRFVEGYPIDPSKADVPGVFAWTGLASAFLKAGFHEVARHSETRPIMRCEIRRKKR
jgi:GNAT superfamily N-acetyltransferase